MRPGFVSIFGSPFVTGIKIQTYPRLLHPYSTHPKKVFFPPEPNHFFLKFQINMNSIPGRQQHALWTAIGKGNDAFTSFLLETCSDVDLADSNGCSLLIWAAANGHTLTAQILLEHAANPDLVDNYGRTALSWAASGGHLSTVQLLLSEIYNASPEIVDNLGQSPFIWACAHGRAEIVSEMLNKNLAISPVTPKDAHDNSPLAIAAANGHEDVVEILLAHAEVLADWALQSWKEEITKDAIRAKFPGEWNFKATMDWDFLVSRMPEKHAVAHGRWEIVALLRQNWEKLNLGAYSIPAGVRNQFKMSMPDVFVGEGNYPPPETFPPDFRLPGGGELALPMDINKLCRIECGLVFTSSGSILMGMSSFR